MADTLDDDALLNPGILLVGDVDYQLYAQFREQLDKAPVDGLVVLAVTTSGGDPEVARAIGEDMRFHSDKTPSRRMVFLGKSQVYSAGVTLMSFFARENRYLTRGTRLMIHERQMHKQLAIEGPLTGAIQIVKASLHELEESVIIQNEGFANLIAGSQVTLDDVIEKARSNWYVEAEDAKALGLIEDVI
jgi:ATP-dependent protease ClpP protease subunit